MMKVVQIAVDGNGNLLALTDDGNIFMRLHDQWQYVASPSADDLPKVDGSISITDTAES